jgi:uncharacterized protein YjbJ (UPF0337 family)
MSENRIEGAAKIATGAIKEAAGKLVGNPTLQAEGAIEKAAGEIQSKIGKAQDDIAVNLEK